MICDSTKRSVKLIAQVIEIFHAYRKTYQAVTDAQPLAVGGRHRGVGHDGGVFDEAFHAAEGFGEGEQVAAFEHAAGFAQATFDFDGDDAAEAVHLALRQRMLRMALEAGIDDAFDLRVLFQPLGQFQRAGTMLAHAQVQGFHAAQGIIEEGRL